MSVCLGASRSRAAVPEAEVRVAVEWQRSVSERCTVAGHAERRSCTRIVEGTLQGALEC